MTINVEPDQLRTAMRHLATDLDALLTTVGDATDRFEQLGTVPHAPNPIELAASAASTLDDVAIAAAVAAWVADEVEDMDARMAQPQISVPLLERWLADGEPSVEQALELLLACDSPAHVAAVWASLDASTRAELEAIHGTDLGNEDGIPPTVRDAGNRQRVGFHVAWLRAEAKRLDARAATATTGESVPSVPGPSGTWRQGAAHLRRWADDLETIVADATHVLVFDPFDDALLVTTMGDVSTADIVATFVPGMTASKDNVGMVVGFSTQLHDNVRDIADREGDDEEVATVSWLGYDAPSGLNALFEAAGANSSSDGADALVTHGEAIRAVNPDARNTVVGHSYGGTTALTALDRVADQDVASPFDAVVAMGAPGPGRDSRACEVDDVDVHTAENRWDLVPDLPAHDGDAAELPCAVDVPTGDNKWHHTYLQPGTRGGDNVARVVVGVPTRREGARRVKPAAEK